MRGNLEDNLRQQIEDLTGRLEELSDSETQITSQIDLYNRRLRRMEDAVTKSTHPGKVGVFCRFILSVFPA